MVAGAAIALAWANLDRAGYAEAVHPLQFVVNDVGMVFFFGLAVKEIVEAVAPGGALHSWRRASVPVLAAIGGMVAPAAIYIGLALARGAPELLRGWAIPCATDIAFSYLVARFIFGASHPAVPFLLMLAIADDALGLVILAVFYPTATTHHFGFVSLVLVACGLAWTLRRARVRSFWPYILAPGALSWAGLYFSGLHPALALVPVLPFVPCTPHDPGFYADPPESSDDPLSAFERWWRIPVEVILFFFAVTNAGVPLGSTGPGTGIVLVALIAGKPLGIIATAGAAVALRLHLPAGLSARDLVVVGAAASIGFTVALFFATAAFPDGPLLAQTKLGALYSLSAAAIAPAIAWAVHSGRFAAFPRRSDR